MESGAGLSAKAEVQEGCQQGGQELRAHSVPHPPGRLVSPQIRAVKKPHMIGESMLFSFAKHSPAEALALEPKQSGSRSPTLSHHMPASLMPASQARRSVPCPLASNVLWGSFHISAESTSFFPKETLKGHVEYCKLCLLVDF